MRSLSEYSKNVLTLLSGTVIAQALPILFAPILTRIFSPEEFAVYGVYVALVTFCTVLSSGRYELAIILPEDDSKAISLLSLSYRLLFIFSLIVLLVVFLFHDKLISLLGHEELSGWIYLLPIGVFLLGSFNILNYWNNRKKRFKNLSLARVGQATTTLGVNAAAGFTKHGFPENGVAKVLADVQSNPGLNSGVSKLGVLGLIGGHVCGVLISNTVLLYRFLKNDRSLLKQTNKAERRSVAKEYRTFPKVNMAHALSDKVQGISLPFIMLYFFAEKMFGFYSYTVRIVRAPLGMVSSSIGQVFYQKGAEQYNQQGDISKLVVATMKKTAMIGIPCLLILVFFGPDLFAFIFSDEWRVSGEFAQILAPWLILNFIVSPVSQVPLIVNKQREAFLLSLLGNGLIVLSIIIGGLLQDVKLGLAILSITQVFYYIWIIIWTVKIAKK
jgi:O-antigen/teichoic acid export membrane protein